MTTDQTQKRASMAHAEWARAAEALRQAQHMVNSFALDERAMWERYVEACEALDEYGWDDDDPQETLSDQGI